VADAHAAPLDGLDSLLVRAELQVRGWQSVTLQLPQKPEAPVVFAIDQGDGEQPQLRSQLTLDRKTGSVVRWEPYSNNSLGRRRSGRHAHGNYDKPVALAERGIR
jgi:hypothetical protein